MAERRIVVVGGGLAGAKTVEGLREKGHTGPIVLIGAEEHLPYERPPLSKGFLAGKDDRDSFTVHDRQWYDDNAIDLRLGTEVTRLDRDAKEVVLSDGSSVGYDDLVLATGSRPRRLHIPGADAAGVLYLRTVDDSIALSAALAEAKQIVLVGAGWIGLEVAANARERGVGVAVLEMAPLPLLRVLGPGLAQMFADLHREHGVDFHFGASIERIEVTDGAASGVVLGDGTHLPAEAVVIGIGVVPNIELAKEAGLEADNGVLVDETLRTSDPSIYAVGDIAAQNHPILGRLRVEHWANALNQPAAVAASLTGTPTPYARQPYFYTDQYDLGMEYRGFVPPDVNPTVVIRGDRASRELLAFWLAPNGKVLAGMNVNVWDAGDDIAALLAGGPVDAAKLADPNVPLTDVTR